MIVLIPIDSPIINLVIFKEKEGQKGRKADYSSDEDFLQQEISKAKKMMKKRAYPDLADRISNKRVSSDTSAVNTAAGETPDTHRVTIS